MMAQLKSSSTKHEIWMERVKQEPSNFEKVELKLLAIDREERERKLRMTLNIASGEIADR